MKKLSIFIILIMFFGLSYGQEPEPMITWEGLKGQKEKSDKEISDAKKSLSPKTWAKRAETYLNIHTYVTAGLYQGMPADGEGYQTIKFIYKDPGKKFTEGEFEVWEYNRMRLFIKEGKLDKWEQTEFIDIDAIKKSSENITKLKTLGGTLEVSFELENDNYKNIVLRGPANFVFKGVINY